MQKEIFVESYLLKKILGKMLCVLLFTQKQENFHFQCICFYINYIFFFLETKRSKGFLGKKGSTFLVYKCFERYVQTKTTIILQHRKLLLLRNSSESFITIIFTVHSAPFHFIHIFYFLSIFSNKIEVIESSFN